MLAYANFTLGGASETLNIGKGTGTKGETLRQAERKCVCVCV